MLDVHPPHGKMHGVGDFFLHLFTITVGLLIALGLEGLVERHHNHEVREQAEANLRTEIRANQKALSKLLPVIHDEQKTLIAVLQFVLAREKNEPGDLGEIKFGFSNSLLSDASWRTASVTGALALMDYDTVQRYADTYQLQEATMRLEQVTLDDYLLLESYAVYGFDATKVSPAAAMQAEPHVRETLSHLMAWEQFIEGLEQVYAKALGDGKPVSR